MTITITAAKIQKENHKSKDFIEKNSHNTKKHLFRFVNQTTGMSPPEGRVFLTAASLF